MSISLRGRTLTRVFLDALRMYVAPLYPLRRSDLRLEKKYHIGHGQRNATIEAMRLTHEVSSYNQAAIIEFVFLLSDRHKKLRLALEHREADLRPLLGEIISIMNEKFFEAISKNFEFLHRHFERRSRIRPRMSVKGHWRTEQSSKIITIMRDSYIDYGDVFLLDDNSGISHCALSGTPYLCNNIVRAVYDGVYSNQRIDYRKVDQIRRNVWSGGLPGLHRKWVSIWQNTDKASGIFKSALVVPIFILNDRLNDEIRARFDIGTSERTIFGYLCFDHEETDFFDGEMDIPFAEVIADILSIYAFQRLQVTDYSQTFQSAEHKSKIREYLERSDWSMDELIESVRATLDSQNTPLSDDERSAPNTLLDTDELLLRLLEESQDGSPAASDDSQEWHGDNI